MNSKTFFDLTLPEQLILLSTDQDGRTSWWKTFSWLLYGIGGAVLQELVDHQKIKFAVEEYRDRQNNNLLGKENIIMIANSDQLNDLTLDQALAALTIWLKQYPTLSGSSRSVFNCIFENPFTNIGLIFHRRLVARGILRLVRKRLWGIIPWTNDFFTVEKDFRRQLQQIIKDNLPTSLSPNQPLTKILLLAAACRLDLQNWLPTERRKQLMTTIDALVNSSPVNEGVARAIYRRENISFL